MKAPARLIEMLGELPRTATAKVTLAYAAGTGPHSEQHFVVLRALRLAPDGSWQQRKSFAILRSELRQVAESLLRAEGLEDEKARGAR